MPPEAIKYAADIESKLTPALPEMPDFKPMVTEAQVEELSNLSEKDRHMIMSVVRVLSISLQQNKWEYEEDSTTRRAVRSLELTRLKQKQSFGTLAIWILSSSVGAVLIALAAKLIHP